ncbi:hypothetical protein JOD29_002721 [Lysinibacillus composti]|uniref:Uncharacterized protein n=1 Tax=Lysinibacillus composti TaxID=720633 RepID=A0A3N9UC50_9BACI|nr:hypothetical protein [Lysinibacillus composti]MBM7609451.1 hypothetical protein [Lysinibacillus composti]RQW73984.1 hypothetical protein EBB45_13640 [Lysinibacillus composti]
MGLYLLSSENAFQKAFQQLWQAPFMSKKLFQQVVLDEASSLLKEPFGLEKIYGYAHLFDKAGLFVGKPWEDVNKLNPPLVRGTLQAGGATAVAEVLSELRILAIAKGEYEHPDMTALQATEFLTKVLALNIDLLLMKETEENRVTQLYKDEQASEVLRFISEHCFSSRVFENLYREVDNLAVQRPIVTNKILKLIASARKLASGLKEADSRLKDYEKAVYSPSNLATGTEENYAIKIKTCSDSILIKEAEQLRSSMVNTGLVSIFHVIFLHFINEERPHLLKHMLAEDEKAKENLQSNLPFISSLITTSVTKKTRRSIYGLLRFLQRDIFTSELIKEIEEMIKTPIHEKIEIRLVTAYNLTNTQAIRSLIVSEMINILGTPLGIGQGFNPTCQSTRALSFWSQKEPVMLVKMLNEFLKTANVTIHFEGRPISSETLSPVPLEDEVHIDAISLLLVPHLDSIYFEMLKAADGRGVDPHKWINPTFHKKGIWTGFSDVYNDFNFIANFQRYYHPIHNPEINQGLPQPAGITIYNRSGQVLGAHAVLIQRIVPDPTGKVRVYFYNPNNDSLQIWGKDIQTSVAGNGEREGESSLPFDEFINFIYAFHFPE